MGLEWSAINILGGASATEVTEETHPDGRVVKRSKKNPWVTGVVVAGVTSIVLVCIDGGKGTISKSFGKVCVKCAKSI
jgi:hypothetical protein